MMMRFYVDSHEKKQSKSVSTSHIQLSCCGQGIRLGGHVVMSNVDG